MDNEGTVQSIVRGLKVIEVLNEHPVTSLEVLHKATGLPKSTLVRLLATLIEAGYVFHVSRRDGYTVTEKVLRLSAGVRHRDILVDVARPLLEAFTREHKWQVSLATCETDAMLIRATTRDISPFSREQVFLNRRVAILASAVGLAFLAYSAPEAQAALLKILRDTDSPSDGLAHKPELIEAIVGKVRRNRYATVKRPPSDPSRSFAIPIMSWPDGDEVLGTLVIFWYRSVMSERQAAETYLEPMYALANQIAVGLVGALHARAHEHHAP